MRRVILVLILAVGLEALPLGAPASACVDMTPQHSGILPRTTPPPFRVNAIKSENYVRVILSSVQGQKFEGFMLQARSRDGIRIINGSFRRSLVARTVDCQNMRKSALTHLTIVNKVEEVSTEWTPHESVNEDVIFRATVAKTMQIFWISVDSQAVPIGQGGGGNSSLHNNDRTTESFVSMYDGCYSTKGCFAYPSNCISQHTCEVLLSFSRVSTGIRFEMLGYLEESHYMAMALSGDGIMGDDSVRECFLHGSGVVARHSYNEEKSNTRTRVLSVGQYSWSFRNGLATCAWTYPFLLEDNGKTYDLANNTHHVLLAKGPVANGKLNYHDDRIASPKPINFTDIEPIEEVDTKYLVKIHGTFMCTAWIGFVSLGMTLATGFKNVWKQSKLCGQQVWLSLHRGLMLSALAFAVTAFVVIFVHKNGWNEATSNPHAVLGCVTMALGVLQSIMALFRPKPKHKTRPTFNFLHFIVGNSTQVLAVVTIYFAATLESSGLNPNFYWVMSIYVVVHVIFLFLFQVHVCTPNEEKTNALPMNNRNRGRHKKSQAKMTENVFRVLLLGIYCIFLLVIMITIYSLIGVASGL